MNSPLRVCRFQSKIVWWPSTLYRQNTEITVESVTVTLFNLKRPATRDGVCDWIDRNADVVQFVGVDALKTSKFLTAWHEQGLLMPVPGRAKRNMAYTKPNGGSSELTLLSTLEDNNKP